MRITLWAGFVYGIAAGALLGLAGCSRQEPNPNAGAMDQVQHALQRSADIQAIRNLMSKHLYYYATGQRQRELDELWATKTQGFSWGTDSGYWVDAREVKEYFVDYFESSRAKDKAATTTPAFAQITGEPVIEVSGDGYTAKGLWYAVIPPHGPGQTPVLEAYGVDFHKPLDDWKIWHFFVHREGATPPKAPGTPEGAPKPAAGGPPPPSVLPVVDLKNGPYDAKTGLLKVPVPYRAFSLTFSYGPPDKR
jgi:hypothetical protein